jgi:hypothetical protein
MSTIKLNETVSRKAFIGFIVAVIFFMITNFDTLLGDWNVTGWFGIPICIWNYFWKTLVYTIGTGIIILLGINNPGINHFITKLLEALRDGTITPEEKLDLIQTAKDEFLGQWADLSNLVAKQKEKKVPIAKLPLPPEANKKLG